MRKLLFALVLLFATPLAHAQKFISSSSGVLTVDCLTGTTSFKTTVFEAITSVSIVNAVPGETITIIFQQDATGHSVAFGGNVSGTPTVTATANAVTVITLNYDSRANTWNQAGGGGGTASQQVAPNQNVQYLSRNCGTQTNCTTVKWDAGTSFSGDATTTSGSNVVTCPECKFQTGKVGTITPPAAAGQIFFATDSTSSTPPAGPGVNTCLNNPSISFGGSIQTTIVSVDSDTQVHVTGNSGTTSTAKACIAWGDDDTTAINAGFVAGGCNSVVELPTQAALISAPVFQNSLGCTYLASGPFYGMRIVGSSTGSTYLIPVPNFTFTSVTGGIATAGPANTTSTGAIGNELIFEYRDFGIFGLGERCVSTLANTALFLAGTAARVSNVAGSGWCAQGGGTGNTGLVGFEFTGNEDLWTQGGSTYFGSIASEIDSQNVTLTANFIQGMGGTGTSAIGLFIARIFNGASAFSLNNIIESAVQVGNSGGTLSGSLTSMNSTIVANNTYITAPDGSCIFIGHNSSVNLLSNDTVCVSPNSGESSTNLFSSGAIMRAANSSHFSSGASCIVGSSGTIFEDDNDNVFTCGGFNIWNALGNWMGSGSAHAVPLAASNLVLSAGWGTTAAVTAPVGGDFPAGFTVTNSGTGQGASPTITYTFPNPLAQNPLSCTATQTGGTNATGTFTSSVLSNLHVTFTFSLTPTAAATEIVQVNCITP